MIPHRHVVGARAPPRVTAASFPRRPIPSLCKLHACVVRLPVVIPDRVETNLSLNGRLYAPWHRADPHVMMPTAISDDATGDDAGYIRGNYSV